MFTEKLDTLDEQTVIGCRMPSDVAWFERFLDKDRVPKSCYLLTTVMGNSQLVPVRDDVDTLCERMTSEGKKVYYISPKTFRTSFTLRDGTPCAARFHIAWTADRVKFTHDLSTLLKAEGAAITVSALEKTLTGKKFVCANAIFESSPFWWLACDAVFTHEKIMLPKDSLFWEPVRLCIGLVKDDPIVRQKLFSFWKAKEGFDLTIFKQRCEEVVNAVRKGGFNAGQRENLKCFFALEKDFIVWSDEHWKALVAIREWCSHED